MEKAVAITISISYALSTAGILHFATAAPAADYAAGPAWAVPVGLALFAIGQV